MTRFSNARTLVAAAIALGAISATSVMAQPHYQHEHRRIVVGEPHGPYSQAPRQGRGGPFGDADRDGIPNRFDRDSRFFDPRETRRSAEWGDWDRDGIVNRFDRFPRNPRRS